MAECTARAILALNAGSSSVKFALFQPEKDGHPARARRLLSGAIEAIESAPHLTVSDAEGEPLEESAVKLDDASEPHRGAISAMMRWLDGHVGLDTLRGIGHRVVHGGPDFTTPVLIDDAVLDTLEKLTPFAPLHQPGCLSPIRALRADHPDMPQIACFDTAFHRTLPRVAHRIALPRRYEEAGIRRYGFHGLSYEHQAAWLQRHRPDLAGKRVLACHIGSGASLCAMVGGSSIATTMGFSVLDGLVMGTRCGAVDPGVLLYMLQQEKLEPSEIENILYHESGLVGLSGLSSDMRTLREREDEPAVRAALDLCIYRFAEQAAAMAAAMQGVDAVIFTGGVGEHDAAFRQEACARLGWLGLTVDEGANAAHRAVISTHGSAVTAMVVAADEERAIQGHVQALLDRGQATRNQPQHPVKGSDHE